MGGLVLLLNHRRALRVVVDAKDTYWFGHSKVPDTPHPTACNTGRVLAKAFCWQLQLMQASGGSCLLQHQEAALAEAFSLLAP